MQLRAGSPIATVLSQARSEVKQIRPGTDRSRESLPLPPHPVVAGISSLQPSRSRESSRGQMSTCLGRLHEEEGGGDRSRRGKTDHMKDAGRPVRSGHDSKRETGKIKSADAGMISPQLESTELQEVAGDDVHSSGDGVKASGITPSSQPTFQSPPTVQYPPARPGSSLLSAAPQAPQAPEAPDLAPPPCAHEILQLSHAHREPYATYTQEESLLKTHRKTKHRSQELPSFATFVSLDSFEFPEEELESSSPLTRLNDHIRRLRGPGGQ